MTFRQFAYNNVSRNKRLYAAYFLSSMFMVMVFFTFSIFAYHPVMSDEIMSSSTGYRASRAMNIASVIIYCFSFFFVLYSMNAFLKSRKKEFGLLMLQGISMRQSRLLVFLENMIIGFFAIIGGIALGLIFAKGILLLAENVLVLDHKLEFYFPIKAILFTLVSFAALFLFISFFVSVFVRNAKLIDLIRGDKQWQGEPSASILLTVITALLLGIGYAVALIAKGAEVFSVMIPVIAVVTFGTYLLFTQLSVYVIRMLKSKETLFWRKTNMLLFSDLAYRMKDNARTFFMVAMISTVAFCAIGTLFGLQSYSEAIVTAGRSYAFTYTNDGDASEQEETEHVAFIRQTLAEEGIEAKEQHVVLHYYKSLGEETSTLILRQSDYNRFAALTGEEPILLQSDQAAVVKIRFYRIGGTPDPIPETTELINGFVIHPSPEVIYSSVIPESVYYVIPDEQYVNLPEETHVTKSFYAWDVDYGDGESIIAAGHRMKQEIRSSQVSAIDYEVRQVHKSYAPLLFIGLFVGVVFFVCAGSFLYFRLYTDLDDDKRKFRVISKLGLTEKELKKVLNRQILLLFFAPIIVALIHGAVALTALSHAFQYNLFTESIAVLGTFFVIQVVYFFIVRFFYIKQIQNDL